jgi:acetyltransferase-like isoleucine patch superfamily enzyme
VNINRIKNALGKALRKIVVWRYRMLGVQIGKNVFISHKAKIDTTYPNSIVIGNNCYITHGAIVVAHDHSVYRHTPFSEDNGRGGVVLEDNVFVGAHAIILRNVRIGENSIISAGAVVTKDVPRNVIAAGNPATITREFSLIDRNK